MVVVVVCVCVLAGGGGWGVEGGGDLLFGVLKSFSKVISVSRFLD